MTEQEFLDLMKEDVLDTEAELGLGTLLENVEEWDSLSVVSFIGLAKARCGKTVGLASVNGARTVGDLYRIWQGE